MVPSAKHLSHCWPKTSSDLGREREDFPSEVDSPEDMANYELIVIIITN